MNETNIDIGEDSGLFSFFSQLKKHKFHVKFAIWARKVKLANKMAIALICLALLCGIATYLALTGTGKTVPSPRNVLILLNIDMLILLSLGIMLFRSVVKVWIERKKGAIGSKLHLRLVIIFGIVSALPTILVAVFSALFFNIGLQAWFSERVHTAVSESIVVAEAYLKEHRQNIAADVLIVGNDINKNWAGAIQNPEILEKILVNKSMSQGLDEAVIFDERGKVIARSGLTFSLRFEQVPFWAIEEAKNGEVAVLTGNSSDRIRALVKLNLIQDAYLYVGRFVDAKVLTHIDRAKRAVSQYETLEGRRSDIEITFSMIFILAALLLLLAAMWVGLSFANQLAVPVVALINAADEIGQGGNLNVKVPELGYADELSVLCRAFNRMTSQLASQRSELVKNNIEIDKRRRFMETVLAGVSSGVVGLDKSGCIFIANRSACDLLGWNLNDCRGLFLGDVIPELEEPLREVSLTPNRPYQGQIRLNDVTLMLRLAAERKKDETVGYVFTFDDITELENAQRKAAWSGVARRIAHEIKNPLTPIQLSAERLKRKYLKQIKEDEKTFITCTDTIIKHVTNIGCMVDEFSSFSRMPAPNMKQENLLNIINEAVMLQKTAYKNVDFETDFDEKKMEIECDANQLMQVFTNVLKNAIESIEGRVKDLKDDTKGFIKVYLDYDEKKLNVIFEDNGRGLPQKDRGRLTEPYMTTRAKGTGLGLAIVKKIMEDHNGDILLNDRENGGAQIVLVFEQKEGLMGK